MNGKNVLGMIFANIREESLDTLTSQRTMGSVPFLSRYRLIDFPLSNMVESGVTRVGVVTNANFNSLMDHVGTGKPWDLSRKSEGLFLLPPYATNSVTMWGNRIDAIYGTSNFLSHSNQEYVLMTDCYNIGSIDFTKVFDAHEKNNADITLLAIKGKKPSNSSSILVFSDVDEDGKINDAVLDPQIDENEEVYYTANVILVKKYLLESLVNEAHSRNEVSFQRAVVMNAIKRYNVYLYDATDSYVGTIDSVQKYYDVSMSLLERKNRKILFNPELPIYTKERDDMPAIYGKDSSLVNSVVADGCQIKGTVENSILFKGVVVEEGAVVKNSILMQDTVVSEGAKLNCIIADKDVTIRSNIELSGAQNFPVILTKGQKI